MDKTIDDYAKEQSKRPEADLIKEAARAEEIFTLDELERHAMKVKKLVKDNPTVPAEVYDIEASQEMAEIYHDMFGC